MADSKYAEKQLRPVLRDPTHLPRRCCDKCGRPLSGSRGHGWPTSNGRVIQCDHCSFPKSAPVRGQLHIPDPDWPREFMRA